MSLSCHQVKNDARSTDTLVTCLSHSCMIHCHSRRLLCQTGLLVQAGLQEEPQAQHGQRSGRV